MKGNTMDHLDHFATMPANHAGINARVVKPAVTQQMLQEFMELKAQADRKESLRQQIVNLLEAGATVEPGALTAFVHRTQQRLLSGKALVPILGEKKVQELKELVEPTVVRQLWVQPTPGWNIDS
jgi:ribosomal protein S1